MARQHTAWQCSGLTIVLIYADMYWEYLYSEEGSLWWVGKGFVGVIVTRLLLIV